MTQQNFRCAGCGMAVAPGEFLWICLMMVSIINPPIVIWPICDPARLFRFQRSVFIYATCHCTSLSLVVCMFCLP